MTQVSRTTLVRRITIIAVNGTTLMVRQVTMTLHAVVVRRTLTTPRIGVHTQTTEPQPTKPRRRRRRIIIGLALLAVAGAVAVTVAMLIHSTAPGKNYYVVVSPAGKLIATASSVTGNVYLWDAPSKRLIATLADRSYSASGSGVM
jgi:hypothetical protein